jgi:hypothetical protein
MRKSNKVFPFLVLALAVLFAGSADVYGSGGLENPWGLVSPAPRGTEWTGTIVMTAQIADVPGLPNGLPAEAAPTILPGYNDQVVKIGFFLRLGNKKGEFTFSGLAMDDEGYYLFYALGDYASGRIGEALNRFLREKVYPFLPPYTNGALINLLGTNNVEYQLQVGRGLQAETPLYYNAKITVVTY